MPRGSRHREMSFTAKVWCEYSDCFGRRLPRSPPEPHGSLAVVPLIWIKGTTARLRGGPRDGLVLGWRNSGPEFRLSKSEFRGPKPESRPNTEGRSHAGAFRLSLRLP
jgi:hypothetical protein